MSHTPGPWVYELDDDYLKQDENKGHIAIKTDEEMPWYVARVPNSAPDNMGNARLIAAAPELLAACEEFVRKCECGEAKSKRSYVQMKAAIAKAKGEAQP